MNTTDVTEPLNEDDTSGALADQAPLAVKATLAFAERHMAPRFMQVDNASFLVARADQQVKNVTAEIEKAGLAPDAMRGTTVLHNPACFAAWVVRQRDEDSVIYTDEGKPGLTAIIDHAPSGADLAELDSIGPRWQEYRAFLPLTLSESWQFWTKASGQYVGQATFAALIEDRYADIFAPSADEAERLKVTLQAVGAVAFADHAQLRQLAADLEVTSDQTYGGKTNLSTGEEEATYTNKLGGKDLVRIPRAFLLAIPVFEGAPPFTIAVRLRFRAQGGGLFFAPLLHRPDLTLKAAFADVVRVVRETVGETTPIFHGTAPSPLR
jgi:hypothetical protein